MTSDDPIWDDLWHGCAWEAFVAQAVEQHGWPDPEKTRQRACKLFEDEKRVSAVPIS
jgi:hypothetical protein